MIYRLEGISRLPRRERVIKTLSGEPVYNIQVPRALEGEIGIDSSVFRTVTNDLSKTTIEENGRIVGMIKPDIVVTKKVLFLPVGYDFYRYEIEERSYEVFESGLGKNQHYFSLYRNGVVAAVVHKDDKVINYLNTYTLYAENEADMKDLVIFSLFLEATLFSDKTAGLGYSDVDDSVYTQQKELRDKYDPTFIPRIKAMDGITD